MTPNQKEQFELSAQDKIRVAVSICGVEYVHRSLTGFLKSIGKLGLANDYEIQEDGSILNVWDCNHLTETELEEFVSWAERENA